MSADLPSLLVELRDSWVSAGLQVRRGVSQEELGAFAELWSLRLPDDFASYLRAIDGMAPNDRDAHGLHFSPLREIEPAPPYETHSLADNAAGFFVFADYSLWAHGYAIRLSEAEHTVAIVGGPAPVAIAPSFDRFLNLYLHQPDALFPTHAK